MKGDDLIRDYGSAYQTYCNRHDPFFGPWEAVESARLSLSAYVSALERVVEKATEFTDIPDHWGPGIGPLLDALSGLEHLGGGQTNERRH